MIRQIYIERRALDNPRAERIRAKFAKARVSYIDNYSEVFNPRSQNFRLQKKNPAAIIAHKQGKYVLPIPKELALSGKHNYYFSHAYNCLYDCRYCFLQAMYSSANYVFFVNYEDFVDNIRQTAESHGTEHTWFFSGYDCDSLAFEPVTGFAQEFVEEFRSIDNAILELRTKSTAIKSLLTVNAADNVIVAFSLSPTQIAHEHEHKAPSTHKRIAAIEQLADQGWHIGLRFDPLLWHTNAEKIYAQLFQEVFAVIPEKQRHSVTIGSLRFPKQQYPRLIKLYPEESLFAGLSNQGAMVGYPQEIEQQLIGIIESHVQHYIDSDKVYISKPCTD